VYFTPYYAMLRAVPSAFGTQIWACFVMFAAIVVLFFLPWLDRSPVKSIRYKGWIAKLALSLFRALVRRARLLRHEAAGPAVPADIARLHRSLLRVFPADAWWSRWGRFKPVPERVTQHAH